ncbi:MAG: M23 family metallopeptidase, partial [Rhodospirillaceae bacterium]|nr:M23 family metallopeptidase [Rhodospirillaceae bacterium]
QRILNGEPRQPHFGVDVAAPTGTPVRAPAGGEIRLAEPDLYYSGGTIILDHGHGLSSSFLHMSRVDVAVGQQVAQGEVIGAIGATGRVTGAHLDWRMNWFEQRLDPALLVGAQVPKPKPKPEN